MLTEDERNDIVNEAVERTLLAIPEVVGNLMANHAALHKINKKFYDAHPEFAARKDIVQSVVEAIEGKNPILEYEEILEKAVPEIQHRLLITKDVDVTNVTKSIPRDFSTVDLDQNGQI